MIDLIRQGDRNQRVADVQSRLRGLGFDISDETGVFSAATTKAVREFQQQRHILIDGIVGPHTWAELVEASWRLGDRTLYLRRPALRGDDVRSLQSLLVVEGARRLHLLPAGGQHDQERGAHREIGLDPHVDRREQPSAATARSWDCWANLSMSSRETSYCSATFSAVMPIGM